MSLVTEALRKRRLSATLHPDEEDALPSSISLLQHMPDPASRRYNAVVGLSLGMAVILVIGCVLAMVLRPPRSQALALDVDWGSVVEEAARDAHHPPIDESTVMVPHAEVVPSPVVDARDEDASRAVEAQALSTTWPMPMEWEAADWMMPLRPEERPLEPAATDAPVPAATDATSSQPRAKAPSSPAVASTSAGVVPATPASAREVELVLPEAAGVMQPLRREQRQLTAGHTYQELVDIEGFPLLQLEGITLSRHARAAIINQQPVPLGGDIDGYKLLDIQRKRITLQYGHIIFHVRMP